MYKLIEIYQYIIYIIDTEKHHIFWKNKKKIKDIGYLNINIIYTNHYTVY